MLTLRQAGVRVPEDVSVIGYDDMHMASLPFISLSTVGQDTGATAQMALKHAVDRLDHDAAPGETTFIAPFLTVRSTTLAVDATAVPASMGA